MGLIIVAAHLGPWTIQSWVEAKADSKMWVALLKPLQILSDITCVLVLDNFKVHSISDSISEQRYILGSNTQN